MEKPFLVRTEGLDSARIMRVVIQAESQESATSFARSYFGDHRTDYRNHNTVEYVCSDFSQEGINLYHFDVALG